MTTTAGVTSGSFATGNGNVGGTSAGAGVGTNVLSMNLGGVNVNYDLGPSTDAVAQSAYNFLDNSFSADNALVGNTIVGSQNFLSSLAAPAESAIGSQENFNTQVLPTMFQSLSDQNYSLGQEAVGAESQEAQASIASSNAQAAEANRNSGGGGGLCFITTAACEVTGEADNGPTLTALRGFRDTYMQASEVRRALVRLYYKMAPDILTALRKRPDYARVMKFIHTEYLAPAVAAIVWNVPEEAFALYRRMIGDMRVLTGLAASTVRG